MRRLLSLVGLSTGALLLLAATLLDRPPVPPHSPLGPDVDITLGISGYDGDGLELEMTQGPRGPLFLQFGVNMRQGQVVLNGAGARRQLEALQDLPNWSFLSSEEGEPVRTYPFSNQLVELAEGETAIRVRYTGRDVRLLRSLRVARNTTMPPFMGRALGHDGPIQWQRGTYPIDEDGGATVPVRLLGR